MAFGEFWELSLFYVRTLAKDQWEAEGSATLTVDCSDSFGKTKGT